MNFFDCVALLCSDFEKSFEVGVLRRNPDENPLL